MRRGLADTSFFIADEAGRPVDASGVPDDLAVSVVTIAELRVGVLAAVHSEERDLRLRTLSQAQALDALDVTAEVAETWARLRMVLRESGRRMPINDSWIAATAMTFQIPLVTQDHDYVEVPGFEVIQV